MARDSGQSHAARPKSFDSFQALLLGTVELARRILGLVRWAFLSFLIKNSTTSKSVERLLNAIYWWTLTKEGDIPSYLAQEIAYFNFPEDSAAREAKRQENVTRFILKQMIGGSTALFLVVAFVFLICWAVPSFLVSLTVALGVLLGAVVTATVCSERLRTIGPNSYHGYIEKALSGIQLLDPEVIIYFAGPPNVEHCLRQWHGPLSQLSRRTMIVCRNKAHIPVLKGTSFPIVWSEYYYLPRVFGKSTKVALYVNNSTWNFQFLLFPHVLHIYLNHGESDKGPSFEKASAIYDYLFVAGRRAEERYLQHGVNIPQEKFVRVSRPQLDHFIIDRDRERKPHKPYVILYAPTFEGMRSDQQQSSLKVVGSLLYDCVSASPDLKLIYRPHPLTGTIQREYLVLDHELQEVCYGNPRCSVSTGDTLFDAFDKSDMLIGDVSSVPIDYLATKKPLVMALQEPPDESFLEENPIVESIPALFCAETDETWRRDPSGETHRCSDRQSLEDFILFLVEKDPFKDERTKATEHYLGDADHPNTPRFRAAVDRFFQDERG